MKLFLLVITSILFGIQGLAQPLISFDKTHHDFGLVANLNYPPAAFIIKNSGDAPLAVLLVNKSNHVAVRYPRKFIQPGADDVIYVMPDVNKIGKFREKISIITNISENPIEIEITGEVVSIQACFPNPNDWNIRKIVVIDKSTKQPIPNADIVLTHNMSQKFAHETNRKGEWTGEMPIGQYSFAIEANKYAPLKENRFVGRSVPVLFFELAMISPDIPSEIIAIVEPEIEVEEVNIVPAQTPDAEVFLSDSYAANNLVLLLDVSYSMKSNKKLELLKASTLNLVNVLRSIDNVALITYAGSPTIVLQSVNGSEKELINSKLHQLTAGGITNGVKGLESAYDIANSKFIQSGNNQVILATDGKFTGGTQQPEEFKSMITGFAEKGIILSIIGFGVDEEAKLFMQEMATLGNGSYIHVSSKEDISETLINEIKAKSYKKNR